VFEYYAIRTFKRTGSEFKTICIIFLEEAVIFRQKSNETSLSAQRRDQLFIGGRARLPLAGLLATCLGFSGTAALGMDAADSRPIGPFPEENLELWKENSFNGNTLYELVEDDGLRVLKGTTEAAASLLYKEEVVDLEKTPVLSWSWKVQNVYDDINERSRSGDDFPARIYVAVKDGLLPWESLTITYVWSSNEPMGETWTNPFTEKAKVVVVQSGESKIGEWVTQSRNIAADYKELFGKEISNIDGYAVMVDGDNTGNSGAAWFADISFQAE